MFAPVRARGLKQVLSRGSPDRPSVRARTGAWIETRYVLVSAIFTLVRARTGAWIETDTSFAALVLSAFAPVRARGLKQVLRQNTEDLRVVRARTGAWIETRCTLQQLR